MGRCQHEVEALEPVKNVKVCYVLIHSLSPVGVSQADPMSVHVVTSWAR